MLSLLPLASFAIACLITGIFTIIYRVWENPLTLEPWGPAFIFLFVFIALIILIISV